jgi:putative transposase
MEAYTRAFDHAARWGFERQKCGKLELQYAIYHEMRQAVPDLGAGLIQSSKDTACEALKRCKMRMAPRRKQHSAVRFPWKEAKVYFDSGKVSIYSVDGRIHAPVVLYDYLKKFKDWRCKLSTLIWDKKSRQFYLSVAVENKIPIEPVKGKTLGIDRGLNRVAVCSNNMFFDSSRINATRGRYAKNRQELQAKGTRSAIRLLRKQSGRERRFVTCENHRISKIIANTEFAVFALEDLAGIIKYRWLDRRTKGNSVVGRITSWSVFSGTRPRSWGKPSSWSIPPAPRNGAQDAGGSTRRAGRGENFTAFGVASILTLTSMPPGSLLALACPKRAGCRSISRMRRVMRWTFRASGANY